MKDFKDNQLIPVGQLEHKNEAVIRDRAHPRAIINLVPDTVAERIAALPSEFLDKGEAELKDIFKKQNEWMPTPEDHRLRFMFWKEYDAAQTAGRRMHMNYIYYGVCSRDYFAIVIQNQARLAWLLCPPVDYVIASEEALNFGLEQIRDILSLRHDTISGAIDPKAASVKLEIVKMLDNRVKGAVVQTNKNLNINHTTSVQAHAPGVPKVEDLDQQIKDLQIQLEKLRDASVSSTIIDIETTGVEISSGNDDSGDKP